MSSETLVEALSFVPEIHLVVLIHGLEGNPEELFYIKKQLELQAEKQNKEQIKVIVPACNYRKTKDGVLVGAMRLYDCLLAERALLAKDSLKKLSLIGHSLGGIY
ncbi:hypothetical protein HDU91_007155, partial [Kappamyces sp. JEL0680]